MGRLLFLILLLTPFITNGQYFQYGLHNFSYGHFNPAMNGLEDNLTISILHRSQTYLSDLSIRNTSIGIWSPIFNKSEKKVAGLGLSLFNSQSNIENFIVSQIISVPVLANLNLPEIGSLAFSFQPRLHRLKTSLDEFSTGSQYHPIRGYDPMVSNGEGDHNQRLAFFSIDAGVLWTIAKPDRSVAEVGIAVHSLNSSSYSFTGNKMRKSPSYSFQGRILALSKLNFQLAPLVYLQYQNSLSQYSVGLEMQYLFDNQNPFDPIQPGQIRILTLLNNTAAIKFALEFDQPKYSIALAYGTASLTGNNVIRSGFELGIKIKLSKNRKQETLSAESPAVLRKFFQSDSIAVYRKPTKDSSYVSVKRIEDLQFELSKDFQFGFNETELNNEAKEYLKEVAQILKENESLHLQAVGHTDDVGSRRANLEVSIKRAQAAIDFLSNLGIEMDRLSAVGKGDSEPLFPNDTEENRAKNRRVELIIFWAEQEP